MIAPELGSSGAPEMSWFQAVWSAAEGALAGRFGFGNTWQEPREGYGPRGSLPPPFFFAARANAPEVATISAAATAMAFPRVRMGRC